MNIFAIADLHLSFGENVDKPMDVFGPSWSDYERRLEEHWKALVEPGDLVVIPGDISWAMRLEDALPDLAWIDSLPGKKLLLKGNHDLWWSSLKKMRGIFPSIDFMQHSAYIGEDFAICGSRGWLLPSDPDFGAQDAAVYRRELLRLGMSIDEARPAFEAARAEGRPFRLIGVTHYPPCGLAQPESGFTELFASAGFEIVAYGHLHGAAAFAGAFEGICGGTQYRLCSLDRVNCVPLLLAKDVTPLLLAKDVTPLLPAKDVTPPLS